MRRRLTQALEVLTLCALFGAIGYHTLAPEPQPQPEPPIFADNNPDIPPPVCRTECHWEGDDWVCVTTCL